jgi:rhodanese-related sulfurtransferase
MSSDSTAVGEVSPEEASRIVGFGGLLLDVREPYEWDAGHVAGAVHIPLGQLVERVDEIPEDRQVVVVCRSGARSARAAAFLSSSGLDAVNLAGGMQAWAAAGLRFESADGSPGAVA